MVGRSHKPGPLAATPTFPPQATVTASEDRVTARLPSGESVEVLLFGATVISWKTVAGTEKLWLSDAAKLDGSKPVRGGIPLVFPVFGSPADHPATASLPSHGFARATQWAFLSRSADGDSAESVRLDFGLSSASLDDATRSKWPYAFDLVYSVTLEREGLTTSLVVNNKEETEWFEVQALFHSYFRVNDIANVSITGLEGSPFTDKVNPPAEKTQSSDPITFSGEMDSVYRPELPVAATSDAAAIATAAAAPVVVSEAGEPVFSLTRDNLEDVVVWNPWEAKSAGMGDFEPKDGWKRMVCVEAGSVRAWQRLEAGDSWSVSQTISL